MAILELLTTSARTGVVGTRQVLGHIRHTPLGLLPLTRILTCRLALSLFVLVKVRLLLCVVLSVLLGLSLAHFLPFLVHSHLSAHQDGGNTVVHIVYHLVPNFGTLKFEDNQRVFLLIGSVLHTVAEVIELAEILFPIIVNDMEQHALLKFLHHILGLIVVGLFQIYTQVHHYASICDGDLNEFEAVALGLVHLLDNRVDDRLDALRCGI